MTTESNAPEILLLHIPGADLQLVQPMLDAGGMPNLGRLVDQGVIGNLIATGPNPHTLTAVSLATGRRASRHGILSYNCPDSTCRRGIRPVASTDLSAIPIWQAAANARLKSAAIGWPATHPADVFDCTVISDAFAEPTGASFEDWAFNEKSVSDRSLISELAELRLHPTEVTQEMVLPFLPEAHRIDQETDARLARLMETLARTASVHAAATWVAEHKPWNLLAVHIDLIERLSGMFLQYRQPRMSHVTEVDHEIYGQVVDGAYHFVDMLLARYLELVGPNAYVVLASDHGFFMDDLRPAQPVSHVRSGYRDLGMISVSGPGIRQDELLFGATIYDVAPTILAMIGLPVQRDVEGRVLTELFSSEFQFDETETKASLDHSSYQTDPQIEADGERRIVEYANLSYYPLPSDHPEVAFENAKTEWHANLALDYMTGREFEQALEQLHALLELDPDNRIGLHQSAQCHLLLENLGSCRDVLRELTEAGHNNPTMTFLHARLAVAEGDIESANGFLAAAKASNIRGVAGRRLLEKIGCSYVSTNQYKDAEVAFREALQVDPNAIIARNGLGAMLLAQGFHRDAADHFRRSLASNFEQAEVHCDLGHCLFALRRYEDALQAYQESLRISPELKVPRAAMKKTEVMLVDNATRRFVDRAQNERSND